MKQIFVANKKSKIENIRKKYPSAEILDITSTSPFSGARVLSPFYPHGNIPIPGMPEKKAACVEAVWQGLKVFEDYGVDFDTFRNDTMTDIKRTVRKFGRPLGHQYGKELLDYRDARWKIYLPSYLYVLQNVPSVVNTLVKIKAQLEKSDIVFLDYNTNCNIADYSKPLSHAGLVKLYLEGKYPRIEDREKFESENKTIVTYDTVNELVVAIQSHPKFTQKKYGKYIEEIKLTDEIDIQAVSELGKGKRDGWKTIIKDIQKPSFFKMQSVVQTTIQF